MDTAENVLLDLLSLLFLFFICALVCSGKIDGGESRGVAEDKVMEVKTTIKSIASLVQW